MVYIPHPAHPEGKYRMEDELFKNISVLPKRIEKDSDCLAFFVGPPGVGKDTIMQQCIYVLDPTVTINSVFWKYEDYVRYSKELFEEGKSTGKGIMHSEGRESLSGLSMMTKRTREFLNYLYENRQMNLYQFIATGDFFDIPKSIVMQRAIFMIEVHEGDEFDKGFFKFYNAATMKKLYMYGKRDRNMKAVAANISGRFPKFYTIDEEAYRKKKRDSLISNSEKYLDDNKKEDKGINDKEFLEAAMDRMMFPNEFNASKFCRDFGITYQYFCKVRKEYMKDYSSIDN